MAFILFNKVVASALGLSGGRIELAAVGDARLGERRGSIAFDLISGAATVNGGKGLSQERLGDEDP